jgi:predicted outer membrane repeat protein
VTERQAGQRQSSDKGSGTAGVYLYFAPLMLLVYLATPRGPLVNISTAFMLKNQLHASPSELALFVFLTMLPTYLSFPFGLARDRWNPFGLRDRGFLLLFAPVTALVFVWMAYSGLSLGMLFAGMLMAEIAFQFVFAAYNGLMALTAQRQLMSGRLASLMGMILMLPAIGGALASGWFVEHVSPRNTFLVVAALALGVASFGMWKPRTVFEHAYDQPVARGTDFLGDIKRLLKHKAIYPAVLINFLAQFNPGMGAPMQYYVTDQLHAPDGVYGYYVAIFAASFMPTYFLYGWLCKRASLRTLLWLGTLILIPQTVPLALIHSGGQAMLLAIPLGLMGGIAAAAYTDLAMRTCPPGLQGTFMMLVSGVVVFSNNSSNILGAAIYSVSPTRGFLYDVITTVVVSTAILPVLKLIPRQLISTSDGQPSG